MQKVKATMKEPVCVKGTFIAYAISEDLHQHVYHKYLTLFILDTHKLVFQLTVKTLKKAA